MREYRTFLVHAPPDRIWRTLLAEVQGGVEAGTARIVHAEAPRALTLEVALGVALRVRYDYQLTVQPDGTEVAGRAVPFGLRHRLASIVTFGRAGRAYDLAMVQGLANLKEASEGATGGET